jgi:ArsR family transcriptional regulator
MKQSVMNNQLSGLLTSISDDFRLRLCFWLEQEELSVGEIARVFQLPQSTVSRHLKHLREVGWLQRRQEATSTFYRLTQDDLSDTARDLWRTIREQLDPDEPQFQEDRRRVRSVLAEREADSLAYFGRVADSWDSVREALFGVNFTNHALLALLPSNWHVVDLGCGTGAVAALIAPHVASVTAVDVSEPMLSAARQRFAELGPSAESVKSVLAPADATGLPSASADLVLSVLLLHHLEHPEQTLREASRLLKPAGQLLIVDMVAHDRDIYRATMGHKHLGFSGAMIEDLCGASGFGTPTIKSLPTAADAKGPGLFAALTTKQTR